MFIIDRSRIPKSRLEFERTVQTYGIIRNYQRFLNCHIRSLVLVAPIRNLHRILDQNLCMRPNIWGVILGGLRHVLIRRQGRFISSLRLFTQNPGRRLLAYRAVEGRMN